MTDGQRLTALTAANDASSARDRAVLDWARTILREHGHGLATTCTPDCYARAGALPPDAVRADAPRCCPHTPGGTHSLLCPTRRRPPLGERIAAALMCPACLLPRAVPGHRFRGCSR